MSYTVEDKLPEDFFQETIQEKVEMIKEVFKGCGKAIGVFHSHWAKYDHI